MSVGQDTPRKPMPLGAVRSYHPRRGRITIAQQDALDRLWATYGMKIRETEGLIDLTDLFGNNNPVIVEIGFGMGDATAAMALAQPDINIFAIDVHTPEHGSLLNLIEQHGLTNVRVAEGDAVELLRDHLKDNIINGVCVYFPDPWHQSKHHREFNLRKAMRAAVSNRLRSPTAPPATAPPRAAAAVRVWTAQSTAGSPPVLWLRTHHHRHRLQPRRPRPDHVPVRRRYAMHHALLTSFANHMTSYRAVGKLPQPPQEQQRSEARPGHACPRPSPLALRITVRR